jgi:hypothetical protein
MATMTRRNQWTNGSHSEADISIFYWRWRVSQGRQSALCAALQWRSSALIVLEATTFARPVAFKHTSGPHFIGSPAGLAITLRLHLCIPLDSSYFLGTMEILVRLQSRYDSHEVNKLLL